MNISRKQNKQWGLRIGLFITIMLIGYWLQSSRLIDSKKNTVKNMTTFSQQIKIIDKKIVDLTWSGGLFQYKEFKQIHDNPADYFSVACEALKSSEFTDQQKIIIGHSMHGSDLDQFLALAKYTLQLLESESISSDVFERVAFPTYDWNNTIAKNYEDQSVSKFLQKILNSDKVSDDLKNYIRDDILTGKAELYVNKL